MQGRPRPRRVKTCASPIPSSAAFFYCQNMTMAQFADQLPFIANGYVFTPVLDSTGLKDAYDFTLSFSSVGQLAAFSSVGTALRAAIRQRNPSSRGRSQRRPLLPDAMDRQLGIK